MNDPAVDRRLSELAERTRRLGPRPGFQTRVLVALGERTRAALRSEVVRSARLFVPAALVLAAISIGLASQGDGVSSADVALAEQRWELDW
jgi:hypothetical protein